MAMVTVASTCNNGMSQSFAFEDNENHLRVASFSSYLVNGEGTFIPKLNDPAKTTPSSSDQLTMGRKYIEEGELCVFSAEKYFSGRMDEIDMTSVSQNPQKKQSNKEGKMGLPRPKKSFKSSTPSTCSEASWNSRSALLYKDPSSTMQRQMTSGRNFFSSFGCNCVGKKAIVIDEMVGKNANSTHCKKIFDLREEPIFIHEPVVVGQTETRTMLPVKKQNRVEILQMNGTRDDKGNFAFPVLNPPMGNLNALQQFVQENARPSLEVFGGPHHSIKEGMVPNLRRSLTALNSNGGPRPIEDVRASSGAMDSDDDDVGSESSSDLFEIESLSNKAHHTFFHPKASDGCGPKPNQDASVKMTTTTTNEARRQPGSLLSCKSAKAVNVVANVHRVPEKLELGRLRRPQSESMASLARFQAENQVMDYESARER